MSRLACLLVALAGCAPAGPITTTGETFGETHAGSYHLGPVDWEETQWTNSCSPYPAAVRLAEGRYLAGVDNTHNGDGRLCDACALVTTRMGKSLLVRIVTTGQSKSPGDMDLSPEAFAALHEEDPQGTSSNPRPMSWQLAKCAGAGKIQLQYQTQANVDWTSLWVRNPRLPLARVEVQSSKHAQFTALRRENDGTWNDDRGFGSGPFTLKVISTSGAELTQRFEAFSAGQLVETALQFD
jgi:expansin